MISVVTTAVFYLRFPVRARVCVPFLCRRCDSVTTSLAREKCFLAECESCRRNRQCLSGLCEMGKCVNDSDESRAKCFLPECSDCSDNDECVTGLCWQGKCIFDTIVSRNRSRDCVRRASVYSIRMLREDGASRASAKSARTATSVCLVCVRWRSVYLIHRSRC